MNENIAISKYLIGSLHTVMYFKLQTKLNNVNHEFIPYSLMMSMNMPYVASQSKATCSKIRKL